MANIFEGERYRQLPIEEINLRFKGVLTAASRLVERIHKVDQRSIARGIGIVAASAVATGAGQLISWGISELSNSDQESVESRVVPPVLPGKTIPYSDWPKVNGSTPQTPFISFR